MPSVVTDHRFIDSKCERIFSLRYADKGWDSPIFICYLSSCYGNIPDRNKLRKGLFCLTDDKVYLGGEGMLVREFCGGRSVRHEAMNYTESSVRKESESKREKLVLSSPSPP